MAPRRVVVQSLNVLAAKFGTPDKYFYARPEWLEWPRRLRLLREEIARADADVVCLQEVEIEDAAEEFARDGFECVVQRSKARSKDHTTGNAVLFRTSMFRLEWEMSRSRAMAVELAPALRESDGDEKEAEAEEEDRRSLYLANVHLEGCPYQSQTRTNQLVSLLKHLEKRQHQGFKRRGGPAPEACATVVCGDFNSCADETAHRLMREGRLEAGAKENGAVASRADVEHGYDFVSAYAEAAGREPRVTFSVGPAGARPSCIDFCFLSRPALRAVRAVMPCASDEEAESICKRGLPDEKRGSDHLPLLCELEFR